MRGGAGTVLAAGEQPPMPIHNPTKIETSKPSSFFPHGITIKEGKPQPVNPPSSWWPFSKSDSAAPDAKTYGTARAARASTTGHTPLGLPVATKSGPHHGTAIRAAVGVEAPTVEVRTQRAETQEETSTMHSASLLRAAEAAQPTAEASKQGTGGDGGGAEEGDGKRARVLDAQLHFRPDAASDVSYDRLVLNAQAVRACVRACMAKGETLPLMLDSLSMPYKVAA